MAIMRVGQASKLAPIQTNRFQDRAGEDFGRRVSKLRLNFDKIVSLGKPEFTGTVYINLYGPGSSIGIATELPGWTVWDRIPVGTRFYARPDRPWGTPSLLYKG